MTIDATFWVMISFFAFIGLLVYFKIPQKIKTVLDENINSIKNQIDEADKLKEDAKKKFFLKYAPYYEDEYSILQFTINCDIHFFLKQFKLYPELQDLDNNIKGELSKIFGF